MYQYLDKQSHPMAGDMSECGLVDENDIRQQAITCPNVEPSLVYHITMTP